MSIDDIDDTNPSDAGGVSRSLRDEGIDLDAWRAGEPPRDFAERVVARRQPTGSGGASSTLEAPVEAGAPARMRARRWAFGGLAAAAAVVLALGAATALRTPAHGVIVAERRVEASLGARAAAVLEAGSAVSFRGDDVEQTRGDVFYRVEPGRPLRVRTPHGEVVVKGTCFRVVVADEGARLEDAMKRRNVAIGAASAIAAAGVIAMVYEGRVTLSREGSRVELSPGEVGVATARGVSKSADEAEAVNALLTSTEGASAVDGPYAQANARLAETVRDYRLRLERLEAEKKSTEARLAEAEGRLDEARRDGGAPAKGEFDLTQDDWATLHEQRTIKARVPCDDPARYERTLEQIEKLGLSPDDAPALREAYERSRKRLWDEIRPVCLQAIGNAERAERLGPYGCVHIIETLEESIDGEANQQAMLDVAAIRAGKKPVPAANDKVHPVTRVMLALTGALPAFEADLAKSFGPAEAHRIAHDDALCASRSTWRK